MAVSYIEIKDAANVNRKVATRDLSAAGIHYQIDEPEVLVSRIIAAGSGDATLISAVPCVLRAVRLWNGGGVTCHAKLHNIAVPPTVGVTAVVYSASAQAGQNNPDQHVSSSGLAFTTGLGLTLSPGILNDDTSGVVVGTAIVVVEYHLA